MWLGPCGRCGKLLLSAPLPQPGCGDRGAAGRTQRLWPCPGVPHKWTAMAVCLGVVRRRARKASLRIVATFTKKPVWGLGADQIVPEEGRAVSRDLINQVIPVL